MAGRWSSENCESKFYKDIQASTLAVDCVGTWALLAGRKSMAFVDLRDIDKPPVKVTRQSKWDIGCVQWNRHASHAHRFVTACNQRLDVYDFRESSPVHLSSLKAHSRTVSDVDWSPFDVNIVASCSVDTFTYLWDVRDHKKPSKFFQTVSGAYQVKWNKVYNNLFATTHDGDVRIWDPRKENQPLEYIAAHPSKIHGLDWSPNDQVKLVTASQDCTIRFWDYQNPRRSEAMINPLNPVWRARYTPFGRGIMSVVVPQIRRGENNLYLWNQDNHQSHVHVFAGHQDVILEFQWRKQEEGALDHQLVTWSKDQSLRIWKVDPALQKLCGHETDEFPFHIIDDLTSSNLKKASSNGKHKLERLSSLTEAKSVHSTTTTDHSSVESNHDPSSSTSVLGHQHSSHSHSSSNSSITNGGGLVDETVLSRSNSGGGGFGGGGGGGGGGALQGEKKEDRQSMLENKYKVEKVKLPPSHPAATSSTSSSSSSSHPPPPSSSSSSSNPLVPMYPDGRYEDNSVPFPRTCGATFCSNDTLVIFNVPLSYKKLDQESDVTPRSLSDLVRVTAPSSQWMRPQHPPPGIFASLFGSPPPPSSSDGVSISDFFTEKHPHHHHHHHHRKYTNHKSSHHSHGGRSRDVVVTDGKKDRERETTDRAKKRRHKVARIHVYNISAINPVNLYLAKNYKLDLKDVRGCCDHNARVASEIGRKDLVHLWKVVPQIFETNRKLSELGEEQQPCAFQPFGRPLVEKFLKHYEKQRDVQSMAMIACMFWDRETWPNEAMMMNRMMMMQQHQPIPSSSNSNSTMTTPMMMMTTTTTSNNNIFQRPDSRLSFEGVNPYKSYDPSYNPYHTVSSMTNLLKGWTSLMNKSKRSRSLSESFDDLNVMEKELVESSDEREINDCRDVDTEKMMHLNNKKILNPEHKGQYEQIKRVYADMLYKWGLLNQRTQILKHTVSLEASKKIEFSIPCSNCADNVTSVQCNRCRYPSLNCAICHIGVRGPANVCLACGHGGHSSHMMNWFHSNSQCPSGCGCNCLQEAPL